MRKIVVARPELVAPADQHAAAIDAEVVLARDAPDGQLFVLDPAALERELTASIDRAFLS